MIGLGNSVVKRKIGGGPPAAPVNISQPFLVGTGEVGTVVTCNKGSWSGSPTPTYTYDFRVDSISVQNGSSNTYTPVVADNGKTLTCLVTATNSQGSASEGTSNSILVQGFVPVNTGLPVMSLSGNQLVGTVVTVTDGTWSGTPPITYEYRWLRNGSPIGGATTNTYTLVSADDGATITAQVRGVNDFGASAYATSTNSINAGTAPANTVAPTVSPSGTQSTGTVITVNVGTWTGTPTITYEYRWTRNDSPITGATNTTYTIQAADDGTTIRCEVRGTNAYGVSSYIASSNSVSAVNAVAPVNTVAPVISGTAVVGQTLSSTTGTWTGIPTPTFSYQWRRGGVDIGGATSSTYTLVQADAGNTSNITCRVTATNTAGSASADSNTIAIFDTIMDSQTDVYNAWSMVRLLRGAYYGSPIIRLRRTNDNAESDFGVGTNGLLDESAVTTWTGSNSATLVTMYAQDGSTRHFTNATPSEQPTFVNAGVIVKRTGAGSGAVARPSADFAGTQTLSVASSTALYNFLHDGNNGWIYGVAEFGKVADPNVAYGLLGNAAASGSNRGFGLWYDDRSGSGRNNTINQDVYPAPVRNLGANGICAPQQLYLIIAQFDADNATAAQRGGFAINGGSLVRNNTQTTAPNTNAASFNLQVGSWGNNGSRLVGYISEIIIFNADKSAADTSIRNNINAIYKTY